MKNNFFKIVLPIGLLVFATFIIGSGCGSSVPDPAPTVVTCSTTNTPLQALLTALKTTQPETVTFDTQIHEYAFKMAVSGKICSIGYQSQPGIGNTPSYKMEILDNTGVLYSGNLSFDSAQVSYVSITPVSITANTTYIIRRTTLPAVNTINRIGSVVQASVSTAMFPHTTGNMTVTSANFYDVGALPPYGLLNAGMPRIDFAFTPN